VGDKKLFGKVIIFGQEYNVETRDTRERLTSFFEDSMSQKYTSLRKYKLVVSVKENNLNIAKGNFHS
jgi:hypothetical protein